MSINGVWYVFNETWAKIYDLQKVSLKVTFIKEKIKLKVLKNY